MLCIRTIITQLNDIYGTSNTLVEEFCHSIQAMPNTIDLCKFRSSVGLTLTSTEVLSESYA